MMTLSIYEGKEPTRSWASLPLMIVNTALSTGVIFWWAFLSLILADPVNWATARHMNARPELFDYPFVMIWATPALAVVGAWLCEQFKLFRLAVPLLSFPLVYLGMILAIYYAAPLEWK